MNFMEEIAEETQEGLDSLTIYEHQKKERLISKTNKAKERISELKTLINYWESQSWSMKPIVRSAKSTT